jgi:hypothetical protein
MMIKVLDGLRPLLAGLGVLLLFAGGNAVATEEPKYEVVKNYPEFELRDYAPYLVAETEVSGEFDDVGGKAFRILVDFISGNNQRRQSIEMTAPVNQQPKATEGEKIAMTAPVTQRPKAGQGDRNAYLIHFVMPSKYTLDTLPMPLDPRIRIREEPGKVMAVKKYSGRWTTENYLENETLLKKAVEEAGLTPLAAPVYARYNAPFTPWFLRRNEVMIEVRESR